MFDWENALPLRFIIITAVSINLNFMFPFLSFLEQNSTKEPLTERSKFVHIFYVCFLDIWICSDSVTSYIYLHIDRKGLEKSQNIER